MLETEIVVKYQGKTFIFEHGMQAYILEEAIFCNVPLTRLELFIDIMYGLWSGDSNMDTPISALADFLATNWRRIKNKSSSQILTDFYENYN